MTEQEAKTKACHRTLAGIPTIQGDVIFNSAACIGSACMAWRALNSTPPMWGYRDPSGTTRYFPTPMPDTEGWSLISNPEITGPHGFCGLAGKP